MRGTHGKRTSDALISPSPCSLRSLRASKGDLTMVPALRIPAAARLGVGGVAPRPTKNLKIAFEVLGPTLTI